MKQNRFTEEQIVRVLKELESGRITVAEQARKLGCSENTIYLWKKKYGGLEVNDVKELRELRQENSKRLISCWKKRPLQKRYPQP